MVTWHDRQSARAEWVDVKSIPNASLDDLLEAAKDACWYFDHPRFMVGGVVEIPVPAEVPVRYRIAQLLHARSVWQLPAGGTSGEIGIDGYSTRLYVLGYDVQKLLRPPVYGEAVG